MSRVFDIIERMRSNPRGIRFADLCLVCEHFFGSSRQTGGSHHIYKTPWEGDPRVNIQDDHGTAKVYQVRQVLKAIDRMEKEHAEQH